MTSWMTIKLKSIQNDDQECQGGSKEYVAMLSEIVLGLKELRVGNIQGIVEIKLMGCQF